MRKLDYVKIPSNFFYEPTIKLLRKEENGDSILLLWMQMLLRYETKNGNGDYVYSLYIGNYYMDDEDIAIDFDYTKDISDALEKLERYGFIKREKDAIVCIPFWKHDPNSRDRNAPEYKTWRTKVFVRDGFTCQSCGKKGNVQAHHIATWAQDESKRFDVDNGITLCRECHLKAHGGSWRGKNGRTQDVR